MTELALPAGSLETALTAFNNGADAVYFGLKEYSARKGAVNFSLEDLSKIRRYSLEKNKKIYITINTLLDDSAIDKIIPLLDEVAFYGNDGIIVQDLGLVDIVKRYYPSLHLHGSTQMAVHTIEGVKELQDLGFERVVLSRELSLKEIEKIRIACPDIELKVFIHGALCYGFSGLCSASFLKCGRSANGGECAQICRSWFEDSKTKEKGYPFSMRDLILRDEIKTLKELKIDSLKVEGRLKSPEFVASAAKYYRALLDDKELDKETIDGVYTTFLRKSSNGYYDYKKNRESLLSGNYPGHLGLHLGTIEEERRTDFFISTDERIENHDGLQYFTLDQNKMPTPVKFSASIKSKTPNGYIINKDPKQNLVGKNLYKISDSTKREKSPSINIPLYRKPIDITVELYNDRIIAKALGVELNYPIIAIESESKKELCSMLEKHFSESGECKYTLGKLNYTNFTSLSFPFIMPSSLKEFRRSFYSKLNSLVITSHLIQESEETASVSNLPERKLLDKERPCFGEIINVDGKNYIVFPPITFNEEKTWNDILEKVKGQKEIYIGLNNISQVRFAKAHPEFNYFIDVYLYLSNRFSLSLLKKEIPSLSMGYLWFERKEHGKNWPFTPKVLDYEPPFFISRTCYRHDYLGLSCTDCKGKYSYLIKQGGENYTVFVDSCITTVKRITK